MIGSGAMDLLTLYARTHNSQFGEDGIIEECTRRLGLGGGSTILDVGASDGRECSNSLYLRDVHNWKRIIIEADEALFLRMEDHANDRRVWAEITPQGADSIDAIADGQQVDVLSLDIDGEDYNVLKHLEMQPRLICAEFNQTIPIHLKISSPALGCSLSALCMLMAQKGYGFIGATHCNAFFVLLQDLYHFNDIDRRPESYLSVDNFTYLLITPTGGAMAVGPQYFYAQKRFVGELDVVDPNSGEVHTINLSHRSTRPA
jgi:hypothetical protein